MRIQINVTGIKETVARLNGVGLTLKSPEAVREIQRGAELMAEGARSRAPVDTGMLRAGVYTASAQKSGFRALRRARNGQSLNDPLPHPPKGGTVLIVNSVFYSRWVEKGRKARAYDPKRGRAHERAGVGRIRRRPFFRVGIRQARPMAMALIQRRLERLVKDRWERSA